MSARHAVLGAQLSIGDGRLEERGVSGVLRARPPDKTRQNTGTLMGQCSLGSALADPRSGLKPKWAVCPGHPSSFFLPLSKTFDDYGVGEGSVWHLGGLLQPALSQECLSPSSPMSQNARIPQNECNDTDHFRALYCSVSLDPHLGPGRGLPVSTRMEAKESKRGKSVSHRGAPCRDSVAPRSSSGLEAHSLKNFTIPKIRRTAEKVYLSSCHTNQREYSSISHTLSQCRLDLSCELPSSWQFGETKLIHNEYLEKKFASKRSEMRECGRRGRELEERYCFLAVSQSAGSRMYQNGVCVRESTLKALGNPLLGVYLFRHADVALSYARSRKRHVDNLVIFKVLYGKVKKIQPMVDKNKEGLDPSPNFDCHMSRLVPSPRDPIEQQASGSAVYLYEYNTLSKPVDRPRQCLPFATLTVRFLGQKAESGPTITSLRFLSAGFPKWPEKRGSLNNCTIAKRIGKGKDATVIYEHFPKPAESSAPDSCSCNAEMNPVAPDVASPCGSAQSTSFFSVGTVDGQTERNLADSHNLSQAQTTEANPPLPPGVDAAQNVNDDLLLSFNYLEKFLSTLSAAIALPNNTGISTVTTSRLIKDPRLLRRGGSCDQASPETGCAETLPMESREEYPDSEVNASPSMPTDAAQLSGAVPSEPMVLNQDPPCPEGLPSDTALKGVLYQNGDYGATHKVTMDDTKEGQHHADFQVVFSYASKEAVAEHENKECGDKEMQGSSLKDRILLPIKKQFRRKYISEATHFPRKGMSVDASPEGNPTTQELQPADFKIVREELQPPSPPEPLQAQRETRNKFIPDTQHVKNLNTNTDNHSKKAKNKHPKKKDSHDSTRGEKKSSSRDFYHPHKKYETLILSHQNGHDHKKPQNQGSAIPVQPFPSPPEQGGKSNPKYVPCTSEDSYPPVSAHESSNNYLKEWLRYERMCIEEYLAKFPEVTELKRESLHLIPTGRKPDASQEMEVIVQTKEKPNDSINLPLDAKVPHFKVIRDGSGNYPGVHGENGNGPMSPAVAHKDGRLNACLAGEGDRSQDCSKFCDPMSGADDTSLPAVNVHFQEEECRSEETDDPHPESEGRQSPSGEENRMDDIYVDEKQAVYMNKNHTVIVSDEREIKNLGRSEVMYSEKFSSTFNLAWKKSRLSIDTTLAENKSGVAPGNQGGTLVSGERKLVLLASTAMPPEDTASCAVHAHNSCGTNTPIPDALMPGVSGEYEDKQGNFLDRAQAVQSPSFGAWGRNVFGEHEDDMDYSRPSEACEDLKILFPQDLHYDNEIEVEFEPCEDSLLQQDTALLGNLPADDMSSVYQLLESRIDWEGLFGSSAWKPSEGATSTLPQEDESQCFLREKSCIYSHTQKTHGDLLSPVVVPDLQIQITNVIHSEFALSQESVVMPDEVPMCVPPEPAEVEMSDVWQELEPVTSDSHFTCESRDPSDKDELGLKVCPEASELMSNLFMTPPPTSSVHKAVEYPLALCPQPAATSPTTKDESSCPSTKPRDAHSKSPRVKDTESKNGKGKQPASFKNRIMPSRNFRDPSPCGMTRKTARHQSSEQFSSLSEGRIKTFSQSERHIRNVLNALYSEASLCKSKRLSRKLDRAVLHLKKAHRGVHRSLQLITKVGEKRRNGPLPKSYEVIRNSLWECCDLEGYNFLTERRCYSRHYWQKRKDDKRDEKRASGMQVVRSRTPAPHHQGCGGGSSRDQGFQRPLSIEGPSIEASVSHVSIPKSPSPDGPHHSESQGLAPSRGNVKDPRGRADHQDPDEQPKAFPSHHSEGERGRERPSSDVNSKKASSAPARMERNGKFFSGLGENSLPLDTSKPNVEDDSETTSRENPDIVISVLKSSTGHFSNADVSQTDLKIPRDTPKLEGRLPAEKSLQLTVSSRPNTGSEHLVIDSGGVAPWTSQEGENELQNSSSISVKNNVTEWETPHAESLPAVGSLATHTSSLQQEKPQLQNEGEDAVDAIWGPCKTSPQGGERKEGSGPDSAPVGPAPLKKNKNGQKNAVEALLLSTSLGKTRSSSSQKSRLKKKDKKRQRRPVERKQLSEKPLGESREKAPIQRKGQGKQGQVLDTSSVVAAPWSKKTPSHLARSKEEEGRMEVEDVLTLCSSAPPAAMMGDPAPRRKEVPPTCAVPMHLRMPEGNPAQKPTPTSELEEGQPSEDPTTLVVKLSKILQKADTASTMKSLQEQIKMCQSFLPLFIEAFERKQKCSFKHVLISRQLLVEGNMWSNCRHRLRPRAVDSLVELQMMMETMQFIENKKGLLGSKPTFRSFLWYDASLYGELLRGNRGYQQQACLYPAFQDRLRYNAFSELQHYHRQLVRLLEEARKKNKSYYAILKYKRQIEECKDIMKHCSDCFDFTLSAPLTCGVNFGDNLEDLERLRKSTLELISNQDHFPKIQSCPEKEDHLWIIMEMVSSKMHFIKNSESISMKISLYGLEHIFFDAAKSLVWKERGLSSKNHSPEKTDKELIRFNRCAFKKLQQIYETLEACGKAECASKGWLEDTVGNPPNICCVGEIIDQAESADLRQLEELREKCTDHLETLKKCFQILQEAPVDSLLITEENVLDVVKKHSHQGVILKPEAVEMYIEMVMLTETIHFLKNVTAKKLDKPRFRGMLWFDLSLLPELIENQEKIACFLLPKEDTEACLWETVEKAILQLKGEAAVTSEYPEGVNSSYALQLLSRELAELSEIRTLLEKAAPPLTTYADLVPYTMSVNYGTTLSELEHNYNQFAALLKNLTLASQKDLGKMAQVMKIMKTIEHLKASCAKAGSHGGSLLTCQMLCNAEKAHRQERQTRAIRKTKPRMAGRKLGSSCRESPHRDPAVSKKRPFTSTPCESSHEQPQSPALPSCKKPKMDDLLMTEVKKTREPKGPLQDEREKMADAGSAPAIIPAPCPNQSRTRSPDVSGQGSSGPSCLSLWQGPTKDSPAAAKGPLRSLRKRSRSEGTLPGSPGLASQNPKASLASPLRPGADALRATPCAVGAAFHSEADLHSASTTAEDLTAICPDHEMPSEGTEGIQLLTTTPPAHVALVIHPGCPGTSELLTTPSRAPGPPGPLQPGQRPEPPNQLASGPPGVCPFSQQQPQQQPENMPGGSVQGCWSKHPQSAPQAWSHSCSCFYPYYSWCVYHYCSSNGSSVTQTYQGIMSYEGQPPPTLAPIYHGPVNLLSCPGPGCVQPLLPVQGLCASHGPLPCLTPGPPIAASPCASGQAPPHVPYPCPPCPGMFPGVTACGEYCAGRGSGLSLGLGQPGSISVSRGIVGGVRGMFPGSILFATG
ncbi:testis-expressed protein 15 [Dromiciops gliroides]|uniref:testis-expressed protein 15 n=1 Tax=Dromiciops gliroides TaxID=33562 RepID=UPI001CC76DF8|nr:testis-expressed protein 15 [Dromiciops gliroides]